MKEELLSHPDKLLYNHLLEVAEIATSTIEGKYLNFILDSNTEVNINEFVSELIYLSGAFHDIGKATCYFQTYIRNPEKEHDKRKSHALLSALFVYFVTTQYCISKNIKNELTQLLSVFAFSAVKRHHGKLENLIAEVLIDEDSQSLLKDQVNSIDETKIAEIIDKLLKDFSYQTKWSDFKEFILNDSYDNVFDDFSFDFLQGNYQNFKHKDKIELFYIHQLIYSSLLYADKNDVILSRQQSHLNQSNVIQKIADYRVYKNFDKPIKEIDKLKNEAFYASVLNLETVFDKTNHIYSVTLPTGLGKTITAFNLADKLRKLAGFQKSKIIVNIPFTSIIDQNFEVYEEILRSKSTDVILKHHHLSEPVYKINENISDYYQSKFLIETWQSDIVVTTFVQLLETLFSVDKAKLMKFAHLSNCVILLDEIQTIPYEFWGTIREAFKVIGETFNIYFILISATQPLIFTPNKDIVELIPNYKKYFDFFNRTKLFIEGKISIEAFKSKVCNYIKDNPQHDVLIILNTKNAALETFESVCEEINTESLDIYFLTTLITPSERKEIIKRIKTKSSRQKIVVSTQLVEAGVDISVNTVFRQLSPIDSIIQAAGRANRYNEKENISEVYVYDIEEYRKSSNFVYGNDLLIKTENVLKNYREIEEKNYIRLIEDYFVEVRKQSDNTSQPLLNAIKNLDFGKVDFELIENRKTESVFIQLNENAKDIWKEYLKICSTPNLKPWERDELFSKIKTNFYDYVINVPIPKGKDTIEFDSEKTNHFYLSEFNNPSSSYNYSSTDFSKNKGYVPRVINTVII